MLLLFLCGWTTFVRTDDALPVIPAFSGIAIDSTDIPGWTATYLAKIKNHTQFVISEDGGANVLRIEARAAAGTLVHAFSRPVPAQGELKWRWKIPNHNPKTDARTRNGDDYPVRLYLMFDLPLEKLSFMDRTKLRLARKMYGDNVPAAALCYVWDPKLPAGTILPNAYTDRVRMIVVRGGNSGQNQWQDESRNIRQDFQAAFGLDAPPISAIGVGGDSDNTLATSTAFIGDIMIFRGQAHTF